MMNTPPNLTSGMLENLSVNVSYAQVSTKYPGWNRTNETPSFGRFYYIDKGEGKVVLNGMTYYPKPGQLMIMPAGTTQTTDTSRENPYTRYYCHFDARIGEWPLFHAAGKLYISDAPDRDAVRKIFAEMIANFHRNDFFSKMRTQASLMNLLALCLESGGYQDFMKEFIMTGDQGKLASVLNFIDERLNWPLEVEDLAEIVHLHPNYFIPYFKKFVGVPPMQYVQLKRMEYAKRLLSYSDSSISSVAEQVGMELAHFSKTFKKNTGVSPSAYRISTK
ncbi:AraC family transcriptional regulator [Paenibacillus sp. NPDC058177]|uniref:AraC family transcriptional regulator n=1 Tax=Paenibacillus sp. NPDC058177 TaxID=3346369 RepID=UPI0036D9729F